MQSTGQDNLSSRDVNVYNGWPEKTAQKVPSDFSYSATKKRRCKQWGFSIDEGSRVMRWTKLRLVPGTIAQELDILLEGVKGLDLAEKLLEIENAGSEADVPVHLPKYPEDIVRDYLSEVTREWYRYMRSQARHALNQVPLDIVISHPAVGHLSSGVFECFSSHL